MRIRATVLVVGVLAVVVVVVAGFAVVVVDTTGGTAGSPPTASTPAVAAGSGAARSDAARSGAAPAAARTDSSLTSPEAATAPVRGAGGVPAQGGDPAQGDVGVPGVQKALVRTAQLTVEVDDATAASRRVRTAAAAAGGVVAEEQSGDDGAWLVLRVPADALDRLVEDIGALGRVTGRSSQVTDATEQVVDLDARVTSQQASVARVRALLAQAGSIGEIVAVESELSRREADLDSLTSRLTAVRDQVALSTLTVDLRGPATAPGDDARPTGFLDGLSTGWDGLRLLGSAVAAVIGFTLPFLPVLAVLGALVWAARRLAGSRRRPAPVGPGGPAPDGES